LERKHAVAFSFFLAIPVILGATVMELRDFSKFTASIHPIPILIGGVAAFLTSIIAISILIRVVTNGKLYYFSIYCFLLGAIVLIAQIF
jgi:undecaprenyl-diphosphatase